MTRPQHAYSLNARDVEREELEVDVVLVGAGPATLACALRLQTLLAERGAGDKTILVLEKAEEIGHHTLSGCVMDPRGIAELLPDWRERGCPVELDVARDEMWFLRGSGKATRLSGKLVPPQLADHGLPVVSLNRVVAWLKEQAEAAGIEVYPGFAAAEILWDGDAVRGVQTRDSGIGKDGERKPTFEPGMNVKAAVTVFGEGARGHLAKGLVRRLRLDADANPQTYGTGIKELWEVRPEIGERLKGTVIHTGGHPLDARAYGGSWIYGLPESRLSIGFVVGLDHPDAKLDPHALFVRWKQHPAIAELLEGGKVLRYGAKTVPEGGYFSMPRAYGDGFVMVGDSAGFLNAATLKGVHLAIKSGLLAAEAIADALGAGDASAAKLARYRELFEASWARDELWGVRNYRQAFAKGMATGMVDFAVQRVTGGRGLVARRPLHADHATMQPVARSRSEKPRYDDAGSMDKLTDVYHSGTIHEEDQPSHLLVLDTDLCVERCTHEYGNPCQHFCPAAVYEWPGDRPERDARAAGPVINASNCVHCKTCDIADPYENIEWVVPEGGGGPKYVDL